MRDITETMSILIKRLMDGEDVIEVPDGVATRNELVKFVTQLHHTTSLKELRLGGLNALDDVVVEALAKSLESNPSIQLLSLGQNSVTAEGAKSLAKALKVNNRLKNLK
jgi:hypothetical protein